MVAMTSRRDAFYTERDRRTRQYGGHDDALERALHPTVGPDATATPARQIATPPPGNPISRAHPRLVTPIPPAPPRAASPRDPRTPIDVGDVLAVGAGAVTAALVYWLRELGVSHGMWDFLDRDAAELHNTNRCMTMTAAQAGWPNGEPAIAAANKAVA